MKTQHNTPAARQHGAVLIVSLVLLVMMTVVVLSAFSLGINDLRTVNNLQTRAEAYAAGARAIEQVVSSTFTTAPTAQSFNVDINNDGTNDYVVSVATPVCVQATQVASSGAGYGSSASLGFSNPVNYYTVWDLDATVNDTASGTSVRMHQGIRVLLDQAQKDAVCP